MDLHIGRAEFTTPTLTQNPKAEWSGILQEAMAVIVKYDAALRKISDMRSGTVADAAAVANEALGIMK
jgi:hypothetical protein